MNLEVCQKMDEPKRKEKNIKTARDPPAKEWSESQTLKQNSQGTSSTTVRLWSRVEDDEKPEGWGEGWH